MAADHSVKFTIEAAAVALPALPLSNAARARVCARLSVPVSPHPHKPELWLRFDEEDCRFLARGRWRDDGMLEIELRVWTEPSDDPDRLFGNPGNWAQAAAESPEQAADLLACVCTAARENSTVALAYEPYADGQLQRAVLLTAFARAALPPELRQGCAVAMPLGAPRALVQELGATVVAYPTKPGDELGEAYALASKRGGILFSLTDGRAGGAEPDARCRAYAETAVTLASRGRETILRFARKAGLGGEDSFREAARLTKLADSPGEIAVLVRQWAASADPDAQAALLEADDWGLLDAALLIELGGQTVPPLAGSALQEGALREIARRPGEADRADLLHNDPSDPAALAHAGRLVRTGLLPADLGREWLQPLTASLAGEDLPEALRATLAQGAKARALSLALLERAWQAPSRSLGPTLANADRAGCFDDFDLALAAERAYAACTGADLGRLERLLTERSWSLDPAQRRAVVRAALSRPERTVGPRLLFSEGALRVSGEWLDDIVSCLNELQSPDRADLSVAEWASLWSAVSDRADLRERLAPRLDERMALSAAALTKALVEAGSWQPWKASTAVRAAVRDRSSLEWLASRGRRPPHLEEWKLAIEGLKRLDSEGLRRLALGAGKSAGLFDAIPYFEPEQTADLIRLAPDDATRELWTELLGRFPNTDPYRRENESPAEYVSAVIAGGWDERAKDRRLALRLAAEGDWPAAEERWPSLKQLSAAVRPAAAAIGALRQGDLGNRCWDQLAALPPGEAVAALLDVVRGQLTVRETAGLAGPLLKVLALRPQWLDSSADGLPALELLATVRSQAAIVLPAFEIARLAAAHGYADRADWWARFVAQARECPRHDSRPNPLESWAHSKALLYNRAASLPDRAAANLRRALDQEDAVLETAASRR